VKKSDCYIEGAEFEAGPRGVPKVFVPHSFSETNQSYIEDFVRKHAFATLISSDAGRPVATHLLLDLKEGASPSLVLCGHMAKANPQWKTFRDDREVLSIFNGPHTYVSASWYSIKSAPTWNYVNVHVYGLPRIVNDNVELYGLLKRLVDKQEQQSPSDTRYSIEGLPNDVLESMMGAVVGFEITVTKIDAAAKLSQNRNAKDYRNIIEKLEVRGDPESTEVAKEMMLRLPQSIPE
jgi:transcriptional regulator